MAVVGLLFWVQWHIGPIGMLQTFQAVGKGHKNAEQRMSWGTGTAIGKVFGKGHRGITMEMLSAIVQFETHRTHMTGGMRTRARLTAAEIVLLGERYLDLRGGWNLLLQGGGVVNIPYQMEYFAHQYGDAGEAFLFIHERHYWEIHPDGVRIGELAHQPYPAVEVGVLAGVGLEKALAPHWTLSLETRVEYSPFPFHLPVENGKHPELPAWRLPTRPPHLLAESIQPGLFYFFHPLIHCGSSGSP